MHGVHAPSNHASNAWQCMTMLLCLWLPASLFCYQSIRRLAAAAAAAAAAARRGIKLAACTHPLTHTHTLPLSLIFNSGGGRPVCKRERGSQGIGWACRLWSIPPQEQQQQVQSHSAIRAKRGERGGKEEAAAAAARAGAGARARARAHGTRAKRR